MLFGRLSLRWWEQGPFLLNAHVLRFLRKEAHGGRIRASASAILLFDHSWQKDMASWRQLGAEASWSKVVPFDERKLCRSRARRLVNCKRAHGNFTVNPNPNPNPNPHPHPNPNPHPHPNPHPPRGREFNKFGPHIQMGIKLKG